MKRTEKGYFDPDQLANVYWTTFLLVSILLQLESCHFPQSASFIRIALLAIRSGCFSNTGKINSCHMPYSLYLLNLNWYPPYSRVHLEKWIIQSQMKPIHTLLSCFLGSILTLSSMPGSSFSSDFQTYTFVFLFHLFDVVF